MKGKLTKHVSMKEAIGSKTAERCLIDNSPDADQIERMRYLAENVFEPLREHFGVPIGITSFFRGKELNKYLHGSNTSQHMSGEAMDIDADLYGKVTNRQLFSYIMNNLEFDQLIWEFGDDENPNWIHVSLKKNGNNRKHILRAYKKLEDGGYVRKYKLISDGTKHNAKEAS